MVRQGKWRGRVWGDIERRDGEQMPNISSQNTFSYKEINLIRLHFPSCILLLKFENCKRRTKEHKIHPIKPLEILLHSSMNRSHSKIFLDHRQSSY